MAGGTTDTAGRAATGAAGALATTGPTGGLLAIARATGGAATIGGACRTGGMILRGSGRATGVAAGAGAGAAAGAGCALATNGAGARGGSCDLRACASSSCFFARMAFITSPGLETCDRSILGAIPCVPREEPDPAWLPERACSNCARTLTASSASIELECVLPAPMPSSANTSRICRLLTSSSRARSLIRTLLIRLFSENTAQSP